MSEKPLDQTNQPEHKEPEIIVNEYGETRDPAVVVDEQDRTVLLTHDETVVIEKEPHFDIAPANRPRKVYGGMWGQAELITAGLAMLAIFTVALIYIFLVIPANRELERNRAERDRLEAEKISAEAKYGSISNTQAHVVDLMRSVEDFEARYLDVAASGRASLYQRINSLILANGLVNTSGPDYAPLELADENSGNEEEESGRAKYKSLYPGVYVSMTVDGSYHNVRRFIREIETGGDFVVVSAVELEPADAQREGDQSDPSQPPVTSGAPVGPSGPVFPNTGRNPSAYGNPTTSSPAQASRPKGKTEGEIVSLRLEMAAYFRRVNSAPAEVPAPQQ